MAFVLRHFSSPILVGWMVIVVNPPFFYGPFAPGWSNPEGSRSALSTNAMLYDLLRQDGPLPKRPTYIDVRDVARSLVNALDAPPTSQVGRKRILMTGEWFSAYEAVGYLAEVRPELRERMSMEARRPAEKPVTRISNERAREVLRLLMTGCERLFIEFMTGDGDGGRAADRDCLPDASSGWKRTRWAGA